MCLFVCVLHCLLVCLLPSCWMDTLDSGTANTDTGLRMRPAVSCCFLLFPPLRLMTLAATPATAAVPQELVQEGSFAFGGCQVRVWRGSVAGLNTIFLEPENGHFWRGCIYGRNDDHVRYSPNTTSITALNPKPITALNTEPITALNPK